MKLVNADAMHRLNEVTHTVRASQAVLQYGVGAMVDFPSQTLMTAAPEYWADQIIKIHDERLEKALHVNYFGVPAGKDSRRGRDGISYVRFPQWYFCPKCRKFQMMSEWVKEHEKIKKGKSSADDPYMVNHPRCPQCNQDLVVARIVVACEAGHIDDFPWVEWVHARNMGGAKQICAHPTLTFKTSASSSEGLEGLTVACVCGAKATLQGAFGSDVLEELDKKTHGIYKLTCKGKHPWKHTEEACGRYPKVLQRGSSAVYFPITVSSLVIPPYSSRLTREIEELPAFSELEQRIAYIKEDEDVPDDKKPEKVQKAIMKKAPEISLQISAAEADVEAVLQRKFIEANDTDGNTSTEVKYRIEEYEALCGRASSKAEDGDFRREETDISEYGLPYVKNISLIHKIREVRALIAFSRLRPVDAEMGRKASEHVVFVKQKETDWYPASEVRGEGIFIELDENAILDWEKGNPGIQNRVEVLNENYRSSFLGASHERIISARFLLLHTLSHALIKQLSFECGYSIASLRERLYCSEKDAERDMAGILIYTASGDSEGTLGGLVRQGRSDVFPRIFRKAIESMTACSNDPVCGLSQGQGRDSLNLAACYSCALLPETSCEEFNEFLDRGVLVGTYTDRDMGFYSKQLFGVAPWRCESVRRGNKERVRAKITFKDLGTDLEEKEYSGIFEDLKDWSETELEENLLGVLAEAESELADKEKPHGDCVFLDESTKEEYKCDLYWKKSEVALFLSGNKDGYEIAKNSDVRCFFAANSGVTAKDIIKSLRRR